MVNKQEVITEITRLTGVKELVEAYEEIAATRMRRIRSAVLKTRDFLTGLTEIFQEVKSSYKKQLLALMKQKKIKDASKLSMVKRNGKTVCIFLASNTGLYGDIIKKTYYLFNNYIKQNKSDLVIIGRLGRSLFQQDNPNAAHTYYDFPDSGVDYESLKKLVEMIVQYEKILVFYGKFENIVYQNPAMLDLYGDASLSHLPGETRYNTVPGETDKHLEGEQGSVAYFFEPSLEEVMMFFESQMFGSIFEQTVHESDLAKYASRMFTLDKATENIKGRLKKVEVQKRVIQHRFMNKKQMESLSGLTLWKRR